MLYEVSEWQSAASGLYYCSNVKDLGHNSGDWWIPARILNMTPAAFLEYFIKEFKPDKISYNAEKNFLYYAWATPENCHKWKLYINKMARRTNFQI